MAQYEVPRSTLEARLPHGVELDLYKGRAFVSLVGFLFDKVRILGAPVPFHTRFEEVNLRYYVRRPMPDGSYRRGVVFISEIVPKLAIVAVARGLYGEAYSLAATTHFWGRPDAARSRRTAGGGRRFANAHARRLPLQPFPAPREGQPWAGSLCEIGYEWKHRHLWQRVGVRAENRLEPIASGSFNEFITEHYFGYAPRRGGGTTEYAVEHDRWQTYPVKEYRVACDFGSLYGQEFAGLSERPPDHVLLAEGAPVAIRWGQKIA